MMFSTAHTILHKKPVPDLLNHNDLSGWNPVTNFNGRVVEPVVRESAIVWDAEWLAEQYAKIPEEFHAGIRTKYQSLLVSGAVPSEGRRKANRRPRRGRRASIPATG